MIFNFQNFFAPGSMQVNNFNDNSSSSSRHEEESCHNADVQQPANTDNSLETKKPAPHKRSSGIVVTNKQIEDKVLELLDRLMVGKTNKDAATIINGALSAGAILKPTYGEFCARYGVDILSEKLFYKYVGLDKMAITKEEFEPIKAMFLNLLS